jgi:CheY-like chemotaxis protein
MNPMQAPVLYVEDETNDIRLMRYAWARAGVPNSLRVVEDGQEAVLYLSGTGRYGNREQYPIPGLILLDLKLPKMSGLDLLSWIRTQPPLQGVRIVALSSSSRRPDIGSAHALRVDAYVVKPVLFDDWVAMVETLAEHWLDDKIDNSPRSR